jgi:glycosyltransferase involved in cell wall biosynthesis
MVGHMKICFYSPYIPDHLGGGEKHLFDVALSASRFHEIFVCIPESKITDGKFLDDTKKKYQSFLNQDLAKITFISTPLGSTASFFTKLMWTKSFDGLYYVTDGSLFFSLAKHNYLHIQVPLQLSKTSLVEKLKLGNWQHKNTNSQFTKDVIEKFWKTKIDAVIEPMVNLDEFKTPETKKKQILNVGRFFRQLHSKRQDVLIDIFKKMSIQYRDVLKGWKLVLVGSVEDEEYVSELEKSIGSLPIQILRGVSRSELVELYKTSSLYWHATGFDVSEEDHPEKVEHFGISTVEAMAAGAIPIVHLKGGQKEILGTELESLGWYTKEECVTKTINLITNHLQANNFRKLACERTKLFSKPVFDKKIQALFSI